MPFLNTDAHWTLESALNGFRSPRRIKGELMLMEWKQKYIIIIRTRPPEGIDSYDIEKSSLVDFPFL